MDHDTTLSVQSVLPAVKESPDSGNSDPTNDHDSHRQPYLSDDVHRSGSEVDGVYVVDCARVRCRKTELLHLRICECVSRTYVGIKRLTIDVG